MTRFAVLILAALLTTSLESIAASYPAKPVRLVVPLRPGGAADILARTIAPKLTAQLEQPIVIDNQSSPDGVLGFEVVAKAPADGYTLLIASTTGLAVNPLLLPRIPYDPIKSFTPVSLLGRTPMLLIAGPSFQAKSVQELIAVAKAAPGKISYATPGTGTPNHLAGELFKLTAGVDIVHVPYNGAALAINDVSAGQVPIGFVTLAAALPQLRAGKLRGLAVTSAQRSTAAPTVPATAEAGMPGLAISEWFGLVAPAATPKPVVAELNQVVNSVLLSPEVQARFAEQGFEPMTRTTDYFENLIKSDLNQMGAIIKRAGIRAHR